MLSFRFATEADLMMYYEWANDPVVRKQSFNTSVISLEEHAKWFKNIVQNNNAYLYVFVNDDNTPVGQVRIQKSNLQEAIIGVSVASAFRGKGLASQMLQKASNNFLEKNNEAVILAYIKVQNSSSVNAFIKAGFILKQELLYNNEPSYLYTKQRDKNEKQ